MPRNCRAEGVIATVRYKIAPECCEEFDEIFPLKHQQVVATAVIVAGKQDLLIWRNGV